VNDHISGCHVRGEVGREIKSAVAKLDAC
jgi:hypothetical protein